MSTAPVLELTPESTTDGIPCGVHGCTRTAVMSIWFKGQSGHVHECSPCVAYDLEHYEVAGTEPFPCRMLHGIERVDNPPPLT